MSFTSAPTVWGQVSPQPVTAWTDTTPSAIDVWTDLSPDPLTIWVQTTVVTDAGISQVGNLVLVYSGPRPLLSINADGELQLQYTESFAGPEISGMVDEGGNLILEI